MLLPCINGLAVNLVNHRFGDGHFSRITGKKEIHVVYLTVGTYQIHAGKMIARPQIREILRMDANELQLKLSVVKRELVVPVVYASLFLNVFLDPCLYIGCYDCGTLRRRVLHLLAPTARKRKDEHTRC